jgi:YcxB-like protein
MGASGAAHFKLAWEPTAEDWAEGFTAYRSSRRARRTRAIGVGTAVIFLAVALWLRVPVLLAAPLVLLFVVFGIPSRRLANRAMRRYPGLAKPTRAVVTPAALTITTGSDTVTREWSSLSRIVEAPRTFVLFIGPKGGRAFTLLAKRGLADPSQLAALRALLQERTAVRPPGPK